MDNIIWTYCPICEERKPENEFSKWKLNLSPGKYNQIVCLKCFNIRQRKLRNDRIKNNLCPYCSKPKGKTKLCEKCRLKEKERGSKLKIRIFNAYGGCICNCCGDRHLKFLSIDHINGGGAAHLRKIAKESNKGKGSKNAMLNLGRAGGGSSLYYWIIRNNYPIGFQVLCMNCNFAKGKFGICPHKNEK